MKKITFLVAALAAFNLSAQETALVVESVDNGGLVPGNTYRVYAHMPSADHSVHAIFAEQDHFPLSIQSTAPFYQHPYGGNTSRDIAAGMVAISPELAFDSFFTIGKADGSQNELWEVNINYDSFNNGNELAIEDGAWFLIPTSEQAKAGNGNLSLLMQFTTTGNVEGMLNLQGWDAAGLTWRATGLTFSTENVEILGCTNAQAPNYNSNATIDNGSCEQSIGNTVTTPVTQAVKKDKTDWSVFPNPVLNGQVNIQFSDAINPNSAQNVVVSIYEVTGKVVFDQEFGSEQILGGNRIILNTDLAKGSYQVAVRQGEVREAQQIVVQ